MTRRALVLPTVLTVGVLAARLAAADPLTDPTGNALPDGLHLDIPVLYVALAPAFTLWDGISMLSIRRLEALVVGLALAYVAWRASDRVLRRNLFTDRPTRPRTFGQELGHLARTLAAFAAFIAVGAVWHRPMVRIAGVPRETVVVDFHTHTEASRDVARIPFRPFGVAENLAWHARGGFDAAFITDHNRASLRVPIVTPAAGSDRPGPIGCPGTEVSAWRTHLVLLGATDTVPRPRYAQSLDGVLRLVAESDTAYEAVSLLSLPEYERHHRDSLGRFLDAGIDGFEIVSGAPQASELRRPRRDTLLAMTRTADRFAAAVTDAHGWGATVGAWSLVPAPGWWDVASDACGTILEALRNNGGRAVQIAERHRLRSDSAWPMSLTFAGVVWESWRGMDGASAASWLAWIWLPALLRHRDRRGRRRTR